MNIRQIAGEAGSFAIVDLVSVVLALSAVAVLLLFSYIVLKFWYYSTEEGFFVKCYRVALAAGPEVAGVAFGVTVLCSLGLIPIAVVAGLLQIILRTFFSDRVWAVLLVGWAAVSYAIGLYKGYRRALEEVPRCWESYGQW